MSNMLNIDLYNKHIVTNKIFNSKEKFVFLCTGGFGLSPNTFGEKIFGIFKIDGERSVILGDHHVERLATEKEIETGVVE